MNAVWLVLLGGLFFFLAYRFYARFLEKQWGVDPSRKTPAHKKYDGVDYVPANSKVVLGHHFSSIAGAGPIAGPIQASMFGWFPVYLWIVLGSIFVGAVHDFGALFSSLRHGGKSVGEIIQYNVGKRAKILFNLFAWFALVLVVAAFTDIVASSFAYNPQVAGFQPGPAAATSSVLYIFLAILFGFLVYRRKTKLSISTIVGVALLALTIYIGYVVPFMAFSKQTWYYILVVYIFLASVLPVWLLLQPRDYLSSFLLYSMLAGAILGLFITRPTLQLSAFKGFTVTTAAGPQYLFPILFVTVACGAISGFHSLVSSGTTAKQIDKETDAKLVGYGGMLIEGMVAIVALISVAYVARAQGAPATIFATGVATFMKSFGIPFEVGRIFVLLAFTAFALTSLDTATRLGRYLLQELMETVFGKNFFLNNRYVATALTIGAAWGLLSYGYTKIWPIFGSSNQLLAALALLSLSAWLVRQGRKIFYVVIPMVFMFSVTLSALVILIRNNWIAKNYLLVTIATILFILAVVLIIEATRVLVKKQFPAKTYEELELAAETGYKDSKRGPC
ncbi:carbon starvation CstA family protein [Pseudothermotoga thermarum]|uniref:Carbon starvation protein CstA n=1 Tax=Pseudothermotoga thermarum DSM 5069 TaxID=688269 RepID=F7YU03_9THEM|nr:carbon starvation protein A [Pseudothermotoga thermarum]AEH51585.1 carbon starvation protein CstA [Pseudothermotoga thermarum DSM 5069]